ncbi:MAG: o-succinylbenzoate--CoA ligase [Bacteroidetes bacterium]|nr:o-succinylbenzoate--CoA ligase [Bacteroidota bacterium]
MLIKQSSNCWLENTALKHPERKAIISENYRITYKKLLENVKTTASNLYQIGIRKKDNVSILIGNSKIFPELINAIWFLGATPVPISTRLNKNEIEDQLKIVKSKFLIIENNFKANLKPPKNIKTIKCNALKSSIKIKPHSLKFNSKSNSVILFTSGSTQKPKAVVHTFKNMYESCKMLDREIKFNKNNIWLASLPFYHIGGFMIFVRSLLSATTLAIPKNKEALSKSIKIYNPTYISIVSTQLKKLLDENSEVNKNLNNVFLGGGPLEIKLCRNAVLKGFPITKIFGSTETCSMISILKPEMFDKKPMSSGKILIGVAVKIVDKNGNILKNKIGELKIKSKTMFRCYFNNPKVNYSNKFFYTNDVGWIDPDGYLFIDSRKDDIIISGGENISAVEVEQKIKNLTAVKDAFVFGLKDEKWGELVAAIVSLKINISEDDLRNKLKNNISSYKIPKKILFIKSIPKNEMGKINKTEIIKLFT